MLSDGRWRLADDTGAGWIGIRSICRTHNTFVAILTFAAFDGQALFASEGTVTLTPS